LIFFTTKLKFEYSGTWPAGTDAQQQQQQQQQWAAAW